MIFNESVKAEIDTFSELYKLSESEVQDLIDAGIISQGQTLGEWSHSYLQHLRFDFAKNGDVDAYMDMLHADRVKAGGPEKQTVIIHGELCDSDTLEKGIFLIGEAFVNLTPEGKNEVRAGIRLSLNMLN